MLKSTGHRPSTLFVRKRSLIALLAAAATFATTLFFPCAHASLISRTAGDRDPCNYYTSDSEIPSDATGCGVQHSREENGVVFDAGGGGGLGEGRPPLGDGVVVGEWELTAASGSFLELARARFVGRVGRSITEEDENWTFKHVQVWFCFYL